MKTKMINYLNKTSKHLFIKNDTMEIRPYVYQRQEHFFKILVINIKNEPHRVKISFNDEYFNIEIQKISSEWGW